MKAIRLGICVKNNKYAYDLASVIAKRTNSMEISVIDASAEDCADESAKQDVVLSDAGSDVYRANYLLLEGRDEICCCKEYRQNERIMSKFDSVTNILQRVIEIYEEVSGTRFSCKREDRCVLYRFQSDMGGSGTTAVALTMARLLLCEQEKKVLYINAVGSECRKWYISETQAAMRSAAELDCMIRNRVDFNIFSYLSKDQYGVYVLEKFGERKELDAVLEMICEENIFDIIIADMPRQGSGLRFDKSFIVSSERDERNRIRRGMYGSTACESEDVWEIRNRSTYNHTEGKVIHIVDDAASFTPSKGGIEIALDKAFAGGVRRLLSI